MSVGAVNKQTGERIPTAGMPAIDSILSGSSTNPVQNRVVKAALDDKADTDIVASDFSTSASYTAGDYCIYEGKFYKFKATHSGAWAAADVDEIKIAGELSALKSGLTSVETSPTFNGLHAKKFGNLAIISGYFIGDGDTDINLGLCSGYYGVLCVRDGNSGTMSNYYFGNGNISGWDGSTNRQFTANVTYLVSGVLVKLTN